MSLTTQQHQRYARNISVAGIGVTGQQKLLDSAVLVVGAGGLGSAVLPYLAGAGVGTITIADGDVVETSNLQRQVLHTEIGKNKAQSAAERLRQLNPELTIEALPEFLSYEYCLELFPQYDVILDCCDSFTAKFMLSDAAQATDAVLVWASAVGMQGQCSVFGMPDRAGQRLYLRDLIPTEPAPGQYPQAVDIGVLGAMVGQIGTLQATEVIKLLAGFGEPLIGKVMILDAIRARWDTIPLRKVSS